METEPREAPLCADGDAAAGKPRLHPAPIHPAPKRQLQAGHLLDRRRRAALRLQFILFAQRRRAALRLTLRERLEGVLLAREDRRSRARERQ